MNDKVKKARPLAVHGSDSAPFIYMDGVTSWGVLNGVLQLETAANTMVPIIEGDRQILKTRAIATSHLRMSMLAARELYDALGKALKSQVPTEKAN